jgi:putative NADPH-quinone reductase
LHREATLSEDLVQNVFVPVEAYEGKEVIVKATIGNEKEHYEDGQDNAPEGMKRVQGTTITSRMYSGFSGRM